MLEPSALIEADQGAVALTPADIEEALGVAPGDVLADYLDHTRTARALKGPFHIKGAAAMQAQALPLEGWDDKFPNAPFPAISLGSDGWGHEFWVAIADARVISVHHDSIDEIMAALSLPSDKDSAYEIVVSTLSGPTLGELLALQQAFDRAGPRAGARLHALLDVLGSSAKELEAKLDRAAWMFAWSQVRDILEDIGTKPLEAARETLAAIREGKAGRKRSLSLAYAWLSDIPAELAQLKGVKKLDLTANPDIPWDEAQPLLGGLTRLTELSLAQCELSQVPAFVADLSALTRIDLSGNYGLNDISPLASLKQLTFVDARDTGIEDEVQVQPLQEALPGCMIAFQKSENPYTLSRALSDPEGARRVDLSISPHADLSEQLQELPTGLQRLSRLEHLSLAWQKQLKIDDVVTQLRHLPLKVLDLKGLDASQLTQVEALRSMQSLEALHLTSTGYGDFEIGPSLALAAALPQLRVLSCSKNDEWHTPLPETRLEELHLGDLSDDPFPPGLSRQKHLHSLSLSGYFNRLPKELVSMPQLKQLTLHRYPRENPQLLGRLSGLESLVIETDHTHDFPPITDLTKLKQLKLNDVRVSEPVSLKNLHQLECMEIRQLASSSRTESPFQDLDALQALHTLSLHFQSYQDMVLDVAPLAACPALTSLSLWEPGLLHPTSLGDCKALKTLELRSIDLTEQELEPILANLDLTALQLSLTKLTKLPSSLGQQHNLKRLDLSLNYEIKKYLPEGILSQLQVLEELDLSSAPGPHLPEEIGELQQLKKIVLHNIEDFDLAQVFRVLARCEALREVHFTWARNLGDIPEEIELLQQVHLLNFHQSGTTSFPKSLANLQGLRQLQFSYCPTSAAHRKQVKKWLPHCEIIAW